MDVNGNVPLSLVYHFLQYFWKGVGKCLGERIWNSPKKADLRIKVILIHKCPVPNQQ